VLELPRGASLEGSASTVSRVISAQRSAERTLPADARRTVDAETWLQEQLRTWGVPVGSAGRWLSSARSVLERRGELVIFAQYDPVLLLFTVELWSGGKRVYGIDDWLG
jgi:hypothetical protein